MTIAGGKMRVCLILPVLALAGCGEHLGWNPNYNFGPSRYGEYRAEREAALVTRTKAPQTIPVARPVFAPTGADIAGQSPVPIPPTMGVTSRVKVVRQVQPASPQQGTQASPASPLTATVTAPTTAVVPSQGRNAPIVIVPPSMRPGNAPPL